MPADLNSLSDLTQAGCVPCALLYRGFLPCKASRRATVLAKHKHFKSSSSHNSQMLWLKCKKKNESGMGGEAGNQGAEEG